MKDMSKKVPLGRIASEDVCKCHFFLAFRSVTVYHRQILLLMVECRPGRSDGTASISDLALRNIKYAFSNQK